MFFFFQNAFYFGIFFFYFDVYIGFLAYLKGDGPDILKNKI